MFDLSTEPGTSTQNELKGLIISTSHLKSSENLLINASDGFSEQTIKQR